MLIRKTMVSPWRAVHKDRVASALSRAVARQTRLSMRWRCTATLWPLLVAIVFSVMDAATE
jgi:hypothetical protein